jgi:hypothetical protein
MEVTPAKLVSLALAAAYLVGCLIAFGGLGALACGVLLVGPLALIWLPDELGSLTGFGRGPTVDTESPEFVISGIGWLLLLALPFALYFHFSTG